MAIDYFLFIHDKKNAVSPSHVLSVLTSSFHLRTSGNDGLLLSEGACVSVAWEELSRAEREGRTRPGVLVIFEINKFDKFEIGLAEMLSMTAQILRRIDGDAELTFQLEDVVLNRAAGQLAIVDDPEFWTVERKAIFSDL